VLLEPKFLATYATDRLESYVDGNSVVVQGQTVTVFQLAAGADFTVPDDIGFGTVDVLGGVTCIYSSIDGTGAARSVVTAYESGRGRVELGSSYLTGIKGFCPRLPIVTVVGQNTKATGLTFGMS
jgi:hypothetical protein